MIERILKYPLQIQFRQQLVMPYDFEVLHFALQNGVPTLWAAVDETSTPTEFDVYVVGTGQLIDIQPPCLFLGTVILDNGLVWHYFLGLNETL